ncbi:Gag-pol fusion protein [Phytophthora megakarya]|uniref:Gag-pol fusion protein n=1 Tax=Phytophthora megakarya TaxID=4795 RepID=A0A225VKM4_9STRA|nr:Gag-pol fusion protein [Phytophthora megakarya]
MQIRRRHAQTEDRIIEENVEKMLKAGMIEEGDGAWGFPMVLVRKKDGEVRFCIDYRALNKVTKKDVYPLPRIDETLEALGGALLFSTLDLKAGYWQILVAVVDRDKTAFTTEKGLFRFIRMPFGLTNTPSTFQRMMNSVLRGLTWSTCFVYLDDIVVFTRGGIERHKCRFATRSMEYLGHELSSEGVRPLKRLVTAVKYFPTLTDAVEVKRFVHLAGYDRRFVAGFGSMMAPLSRLLRKKVHWEWGDEQKAGFDKVKAVLTSKPLLVYPDFRLPFTLVTDASKVGLGACLMQNQGNRAQPVSYASKAASETEAKYGITELECLAELNFVVQYRLRSTNVVADALSRAPVVATEDMDQAVHPFANVRSNEDDAAVVTCRDAVNDTTDDDSAVFGVNGGDGKLGVITDDEDVGTSDMATAATGQNGGVANSMDTAAYLEAVTMATDDQSSSVVTLEDDLTYEATPVARVTMSPVSGVAATTEDSVGERRVTFAVLEGGEASVATTPTGDGGMRNATPFQFAGDEGTKQEALRNTPEESTEVRVTHMEASTDDDQSEEDEDADTAARPAAPERTNCEVDVAVTETERLRAVNAAREAAATLTLQHTDDDIASAQKKSPLPATDEDNQFVVAAVEYVTPYAVAVTVKQHTADNVAALLMRNVVLRFGPFRESVTDDAPELTDTAELEQADAFGDMEPETTTETASGTTTIAVRATTTTRGEKRSRAAVGNESEPEQSDERVVKLRRRRRRNAAGCDQYSATNLGQGMEVRADDDGCPCENMNGIFGSVESWKTPMVVKSCRRSDVATATVSVVYQEGIRVKGQLEDPGWCTVDDGERGRAAYERRDPDEERSSNEVYEGLAAASKDEPMRSLDEARN